MYRKASYFKVPNVEQLTILVYKDRECKECVIQIHLNFDVKLSSVVLIPRSYGGYSLNLQMDELRRAYHFVDLRGWRNRCKDYDYIVNSVL